MASLLGWISWPNGLSTFQFLWVRGSSLCFLWHTYFLTMWYIVLAYPLWYLMTKILSLHHSSGPPFGISLGLVWHYHWLTIYSWMAKLNACIIPWSKFSGALPSDSSSGPPCGISLGLVWHYHWLTIYSWMAKLNACIIPWSKFSGALPSDSFQRISGQIYLGV